VTWTEPITSDNSGIASLTSSHSSGSTFEIGDTIVTYTATDDASNMVTDTFTVTIEGMCSVICQLLSFLLQLKQSICNN
jgi:hypothetical protein